MGKLVEYPPQVDTVTQKRRIKPKRSASMWPPTVRAVFSNPLIVIREEVSRPKNLEALAWRSNLTRSEQASSTLTGMAMQVLEPGKEAVESFVEDR
jgi:hypothetical protein